MLGIGLGRLSRLRPVSGGSPQLYSMNFRIETWSLYWCEMCPAVVYGRDHDHRNAGAVTEEVQRLNVAGVIVAAAFVEGDEDRRGLPQSRIGLHSVDDLLHEAFEQIQLRGSRVAIDESARLHIRDGRQVAAGDIGVQVVVSFRCAVRTASLVMIEVEYWKKLQMLQYSSRGFWSYLSCRYRFHWSP